MTRRLRVTPRDRQSGPHAPAPVLTVTGELLAELKTLCPHRSRWRLVHSPAAIDATAVIANRPVRSP
jgi:hypothetical protein